MKQEVYGNMATTQTPLRYPVKEAVELLRVGMSTFRRLLKEKEFTVIRDRPDAGKGSPAFVPADEIEVFALGGLEALREYRAKKKRRK
jgi:hypothetical protein